VPAQQAAPALATATYVEGQRQRLRRRHGRAATELGLPGRGTIQASPAHRHACIGPCGAKASGCCHSSGRENRSLASKLSLWIWGGTLRKITRGRRSHRGCAIGFVIPAHLGIEPDIDHLQPVAARRPRPRPWGRLAVDKHGGIQCSQAGRITFGARGLNTGSGGPAPAAGQLTGSLVEASGLCSGRSST